MATNMAAAIVPSSLRVIRAVYRLEGRVLHGCCVRRQDEAKRNTQSEGRKAAQGPKKDSSPRILLLQEKRVTAMTFDEGGRLAKRRGMEMVEGEGEQEGGPRFKTDLPVYRLVAKREVLKQGGGGTTTDAGKEKMVALKWKISPHDLDIKMKQAKKWIEKGSTVRVVIAGEEGNPEAAESVFKTVEANAKEDAKIVQKRMKGNEIRFQMMPLKKPS